MSPYATTICGWRTASKRLPRYAEVTPRIKSPFVVTIAAIALAACVSAPKADPATERAAKAFAAIPGKAQLYIVRPSSFGTAVLYQVAIDGRLLGSLPGETFLLATLEPGSHVVSFTNATSQENTPLQLEPGKNYFLRVGMHPGSMSNRARTKLVDEQEGRGLVFANAMVQSTASLP